MGPAPIEAAKVTIFRNILQTSLSEEGTMFLMGNRFTAIVP
jgi:hypothetical protein